MKAVACGWVSMPSSNTSYGSTRRQWLQSTAALAGLLLSGAAPASSQPLQITDLRGRTVRLPKPAQRMVLGATDDFVLLSMLDKQPARNVVAWNKWRLDAQSLLMLRGPDTKAFDHMAQLAIDGPQSLHAESLIALEPDLIVLDAFYAKATQTVARLEKAGIPVAVLEINPDLRQPQPTQGLIQFGILTGHEARAREVASFIEQRVHRIREGVQRLKSRGAPEPLVLMEPHAGSAPCCLSMGNGKNLGDMVRMAGGRLMGGELIAGMAGTLSTEYVIDQDPEIYIGTGGGHLKARNGLLLGPGVSASQAHSSLQHVIQRTGLSHTRAIRNRRVHGIWHGGLGIVNLECIASWLHPEEFADVRPQATLDALNQRFLAFPWQGTFWTSLQATAAPRP